jgi:electron transfer flavoprotein alpha subunit
MILVVAEQRDGTLNRATWETIVAAQQAGGPIKIAVLGPAVDAVASEVAAADASEIIVVEDPALKE